MADQRQVAREKVISAQTSAASGTNVRATISRIADPNGEVVSLVLADELLVYLDVNTALVGTAPTMDIYLQMAVVPNPNPATDAHWTDIAAFAQVTTALVEKLLALPYTQVGAATGAGRAAANARDRTHATITADTMYPTHWGDQIRMVEKMGGTVTTQAIYDVTITAIVRK